jgi:outer membrane receptor protein involved in Fe transport
VTLGLQTVVKAQTPQNPPTFSVSVTEPYELVEEIGTVRRIGRSEIEARNARTLDEALRLFPGVYVRTGGDGTPRIDIRGFRSRHVLLLINGVLVNSTADGQFDPAQITTNAIREIKVAYGTSSVLYGDNAMAAVIEITTIDGKPDSSADVSAGTPEQKGVGGRYARTIGKWSFAGTSTGYATEAFPLPDSFIPTAIEDGGRRLNSNRDRSDLRGAVGYRASSTVSLASEWFFGAGSYGVPPGTINNNADIFAQTPRFERVEAYRAGTGQISLFVTPSPRLNLRAWVFRNAQREDRNRYDDATFTDMDDPLVSGTFQQRERTTVTGSSALARVSLERLGSLRIAVNQRRESLDSSGLIRDVSVSGGGGSGGRGGGSQQARFDVRAFSIDRHVDVYSTGVEWQSYPAKRLGTVLGAAANVQQRPGGVSESAPTWLAGVSYAATDALRVRGSIARKIRVPSIEQLFNASAGNPDLHSERANSLDVGADYRVARLSTVGVSVFSTQARDFIERTSPAPFENQDRYRFRGIELTGGTTAFHRLDLHGSYSFLDSDNLRPDGTRSLQTRPRHRGDIQWNWTPAAGSAVRGAVYSTAAQLYDSRGSDPVQREANGFTLVDLGFTQRVARHYHLAVDVTNLFDHLYDQSYGLPREGRVATFTARIR